MARVALNTQSEALAHMGLGICKFKTKDYEAALMHLEKALNEAKRHNLDKVTTMISRELAGV